MTLFCIVKSVCGSAKRIKTVEIIMAYSFKFSVEGCIECADLHYPLSRDNTGH